MLWSVVKLVKLLLDMYRGSRGGVILEFHEDGSVERGVWRRRYKTWRGWWIGLWRREKGVVRLEEDEDLLG